MTATPGGGTPSTTAPTGATILESAFYGGGANAQQHTVGAGVYSARVDLWGGSGTLGGELGGYQSGIIQTSPGQILYINFPQDGGPGGATNTSGGSTAATVGGTGGTSADLRVGSNDISSRVIVAGGGGGNGGDGSYTTSAPVGGFGTPGGSQPWASASPGANNNNGTAAGGGPAVGPTPGAPGANSSASTAITPTAGQMANVANVGGAGGAGPANAGWPAGSGGGGGGGFAGGAGGGGGGGDAGSVANSSGAAGGGGTGGTSWSDPTQCAGIRTLSPNVPVSPYNGGQVAMVTPNPPTAAILTPPPAAVIDCNAGFSFVISYNSATPVSAAYHMIRRRVLGGTAYQWWNGGGWSSTEVLRTDTTSAGANSTINFSSGEWVNGASWEVSVAFLDSNLAVGAYSTPVIIKAQTAPAVTITVPATTMEATLSWAATFAPNASQVSYRAMLYTATVAATSGFVFGQYATNAGVPTVPQIDTQVVYGQESSWVAPDDNGNGAQPFMLLPSTGYVIGVQITQTSGQTQVGTASTGFTYASFTSPASGLTAPGITVTPSSVPTAPTAIIVLTGASGVPVNVQRSYDGGNTWLPLRSALIGNYTGPIYDAEVCPNAPTVYRASIRNSGLTFQSTFTPSGSITVTPFNFWLSNPLIPGSAIPVSLAPGTFGEGTGERQAVYNLLGNEYPVVLADTIQASSLTLNFVFLSDAAYQAFEALRQSQAVLLLQAATWAQQWYVRLGPSFDVEVNTLASRQLGQVIRTVSGTAQAVATP
jgi:hypothetical protein